MKRPGLTEAMRAALEDVDSASVATRKKLHDLGLIRFGTFNGMRVVEVTPRGQAALAAPRMTAAELAMLERLESWEGTIHGRDVTVAKSLRKKGLALCGFGSSGYRRAKITPAGTTALNNIRAASGSPDWREQS